MKSTNAQVELRTSEIYDLLLQGATRTEILQYAAKNWKVSERQTDSYISKATQLVENDSATQREEVLTLTKARLQHLYRKSVEAKDYRAALLVLKEQSSLLGLYPQPTPPTPPPSPSSLGSASSPDLFTKSILGLDLWHKQQEVAQAIAQHNRVTVQSGHKTGKTTIAAAIALWWVSDPEKRPQARAIITAPTARQIKSLIWREIKRLYFSAERGGHPLGGELAKDPRTGLQFPDGREIVGAATNETDRLGGYSGEHLLFIVDEASGVDVEIFEALEGNSAGGAKFLLMGNPLRRSGPFYEANTSPKLKDSYKRFKISSRDTPTAQGKQNIKGLATKEWSDELLKRWGPNDPRYQVRVLGEYPDQASNAVISSSVIREAQGRYDTVEARGSLVFGLDPARFGDDDSVLCPRRGLKVYPLITLPKGDGPTVAAAARREALKFAIEEGVDVEEVLRICVDVIGVGASVYDALGGYKDIDAVSVNFANASEKDEEYQNVRDELYFAAQEYLKEGGALPDNDELREELEAHLYDFDRQGRCKVAPKDSIKEQLGRSPDRAEAFVLSLYQGPNVKFTRLRVKVRNDRR